LDNTIIQVKAGTAKGLTSQITKTAAGTTKEVIGFARIKSFFSMDVWQK